MIELLPDLPNKVVGIIASGQVTASDYEDVVIPAIESTIETRGMNHNLSLFVREFTLSMGYIDSFPWS